MNKNNGLLVLIVLVVLAKKAGTLTYLVSQVGFRDLIAKLLGENNSMDEIVRELKTQSDHREI